MTKQRRVKIECGSCGAEVEGGPSIPGWAYCPYCQMDIEVSDEDYLYTDEDGDVYG